MILVTTGLKDIELDTKYLGVFFNISFYHNKIQWMIRLPYLQQYFNRGRRYFCPQGKENYFYSRSKLTHGLDQTECWHLSTRIWLVDMQFTLQCSEHYLARDYYNGCLNLHTPYFELGRDTPGFLILAISTYHHTIDTVPGWASHVLLYKYMTQILCVNLSVHWYNSIHNHTRHA